MVNSYEGLATQGHHLVILLNRGNEGLTDPDDVPELPAKATSRIGDVWLRASVVEFTLIIGPNPSTNCAGEGAD